MKSALGFDKNGKLVKITPVGDMSEYGAPEVWFAASEITEADAAAFIPHGDGVAELLAERLNRGLQDTLAALRRRRQKLAEVKACAEAISKVLAMH